MKHIWFVVVLLIFTVCNSSGVLAQLENDKQKLILLPVQGEGLSSSDKTAFQGAIKQGLSSTYKIFSGEQVQKKLEKIATTSCSSDECLEKIAIAFNGNLVCRGYVENEGGSYLLSLEIKDVFTDEDVFAYTVGCPKCSKVDIIESLKKMAYSVGFKDKTDSVGKIAVAGYGDLKIESEPTGTDITVKNEAGNIVGLGVSPETFRVKAGMYHVRLKKTGYETQDLKINVFRDSTQIVSGKEATLRKFEAFVNIDTQPSSKNHDIYIDGEMVGKTPAKLKLTAGIHTIEIKNKYQIGQNTIFVKDGVESTETIKLRNISKKYSLAVVADAFHFAPGKFDETYSLYGLEYRHWLWNIGYLSVEGLVMPEKDSDMAYGDGYMFVDGFNNPTVKIRIGRVSFDVPIFNKGREGFDIVVGAGYEYMSMKFDNEYQDSFDITKKSLLLETGVIYIDRYFFSELKVRYLIGENDKLNYDYGAKLALGVRF